MSKLIVPELSIVKKHCNSAYAVTYRDTAYFLDEHMIFLLQNRVTLWSRYSMNITSQSSPDWVYVAENLYAWPIKLIEQIWSLEKGVSQIITFNREYTLPNLFDDEPTKKIEVCLHPKKYKNGIGGLVFWVCPDCKEEVK